jgi:hypothetical protein
MQPLGAPRRMKSVPPERVFLYKGPNLAKGDFSAK